MNYDLFPKDSKVIHLNASGGRGVGFLENAVERVKRNVLIQFTIVVFVLVLAGSLILGFFINKTVANETIQVHTQLYPALIEHEVLRSPSLFAFMRGPERTINQKITTLFSTLVDSENVFRIKVWGPDGTIIWSDNPEIVGKQYPNDSEYKEAMTGVVSFSLEKPEKEEQANERKRGHILEIYTPVKEEGKPIGIVEVYEDADQLMAQIRKRSAFVWKIVIVSGLALYALLFSFFYSAYRREERSSENLQSTRDALIYMLAYLAEMRDIETGKHLERTSSYVRVLATEMQKESPYSEYLTDAYINDLVKASPLHDVGKVGIPDAILFKPGKLTDDEFNQMKRHTEYGAKVLREASEKLTFRSFLTMATQVAVGHHERWDGNGYPYGLAGDDIPLSARIMAIADVYDALRSRRSYKAEFDHVSSRDFILAQKGTQFDPWVVEAFERGEKEFERISVTLADDGTEPVEISEILSEKFGTN